MPLQFGLLTGKFDSGVSFPANDHRKNRLTPEIISTCKDALSTVWELCKKYNCSKTQLALSFILSYKQVSVIIPGIRTAAHVKDNTTGLFRLAPEDIKMIETAGASFFLPVMDRIKKLG
jgi:aryl-alcohol dehydrogenase-like predicted oxidoreductase